MHWDIDAKQVHRLGNGLLLLGETVSLRIKVAQKPYTRGSLGPKSLKSWPKSLKVGPKALEDESLEGKGTSHVGLSTQAAVSAQEDCSSGRALFQKRESFIWGYSNF